MSKEKMHPSNIQDYTEKTWFLGTDILDHKNSRDLDLMEEGKVASFTRDEGAIYSTLPDFLADMKKEGYSTYFQELMKEARKRGYAWVFFDRDIETGFKK